MLFYCTFRLLSQQLRCYGGFIFPLSFGEGKAGFLGGILFYFGSGCTRLTQFVYKDILHVYVVEIS